MTRHVPTTGSPPTVPRQGGPAPAEAPELAEIRRLLRDDRSQAAIAITERLAAEATDPYVRTFARVMRIACLINLDRGAELPAALDQAAAALRAHPDSHLTATFHSFAAMAAQVDGSLQRSVTHLVRAARALTESRSPAAAGAWENLAVTYSHCGFHAHATDALRRARAVSGGAGRRADRPLVSLRYAVSLDHSGDTEGARRVLREMLRGYLAHRNENTAGDHGFDTLLYGYGVVRLAVLGERVAVDPHPLLACGGRDPASHRVRTLAAACRAIADDEPAEALDHLAAAEAGPATPFGHLLGRPEPVRLRALALAQAGDAAAALEESRHAFRLATRTDDRLRDLFVDGVAARLDHEDLRRTVARFTDVTVTDPLTGLLDRGQVERYVATLAGRDGSAMIGVADLDGFTAVNTIHGHLTGDLVLQRVAGLLARAVRRGDFIARYGGDEFLVVLPHTTLAAAHDIGNRITTTINNEDWHALVPGTPITISIGWAPLDHHTNLTTAFEAAARRTRPADAAGN